MKERKLMNVEERDYAAEFDPSFVRLARVLDELPGIRAADTYREEDRWTLWFRLDIDADGRPSEDAWVSLEFLAWIVVHDMGRRAGRRVRIVPHSVAPDPDALGEMLSFMVEGLSGDDEDDVEPDNVADLVYIAHVGD